MFVSKQSKAGYRDPLTPKITGREYVPRHGGVSVLCLWWSHTCLPSVCPNFVGDQPWARWPANCIIEVHMFMPSCCMLTVMSVNYHYHSRTNGSTSDSGGPVWT